MKVFISWSGDRSKAVANLLGGWLKCVLQSTDPWVSTSNIDNGTVWFTEISKVLSEVQVGIFCITPENREKPWILFEAGAISSKLNDARVICLILGEQTKNDIMPPLSQFHSALPEKGEMLKLVVSINKLLTTPLPGAILDTVFEKYWPDFEEGYKAILETIKPENIPAQREKNDILNEILTSVRGFDQRIRHLEGSIPKTFSSTPERSFHGINFEEIENESLLDNSIDTLQKNIITQIVHYQRRNPDITEQELLDKVYIKLMGTGYSINTISQNFKKVYSIIVDNQTQIPPS